MTTEVDNSNKFPMWLDAAAKLATITIAIVAVISAFVAMLHFTIRADVTPQLTAIEAQLVGFEQKTEVQFEAIGQRFNAIDQKFDAIDQKFDAIGQRFNVSEQRFNAIVQRLERIENLLQKR